MNLPPLFSADLKLPISAEICFFVKRLENKNFLAPNKFNARNEINNKARGLAEYLL